MATLKKCPACGVKVKVENIEGHLARVHPGQDLHVDLSLDETQALKEARKVPGGRPGPWSLVAAIVLILILVGAGVAVFTPSPPTKETNARISIAPPLMFDFGQIPREIQSHDFVVSNVGDDPLVIKKISTSCHCTTATLIYGGRESPTFGMGGSSSWSETIYPGETAILRVFYDPNYHPDTGPIVRQVYIASNDSTNREAEVEIRATVVP
jgi:hypothetical protein